MTAGPAKDRRRRFPLATARPCNGGPEQDMGGGPPDGGGLVRNKGVNLCLDVRARAKVVGAPVGFHACTNGAANAVWTAYASRGDNRQQGGVQLRVQETGFCLTACG